MVPLVSSSLEDYFQGSGRGGRSGYWKPRECQNPSTARDQEVIDVRHYLENSSDCRRKVLLKHFDVGFVAPGSEGHQCCDVCASKE